MKRKHKARLLRQISVGMCLAFLIGLFPLGNQEVMASTWDNAYTYYQKYGNDVVFKPTSSNDGEIYYATKAGKATTNTRYRTIGWKVTLQKRSGSKLQTIYFKLGGSYMYKKNSVTKSNYEYNLYALSLGSLKRRMNDASIKAMKKGDIQIVFDACMIVVKDGKPKGAMNDSGPTSGSVYTTYNGIAGAASWSSTAKQSFYNYFNKSVINLFFAVQVRKQKGISSVSGSGEYCFGTYATLKAKVEEGYEFDCWQGPGGRDGCEQMSTCVDSDQTWTAVARPKELLIVFHRNKNAGDTLTTYQRIYYGNEGFRFVDTGWNGDKNLLGWALSKNAEKRDYSVNALIKGSWILTHSPQVDLYAVWDQPSTPTPSTPTPSTPTPSTPTPSTPTPSTPTPSTPTPSTPTPSTPTPSTPTPSTPTPSTPTPSTPTPSTPTPSTPTSPSTPEITPVNPEPSVPEPEENKNRQIQCRFISWKYFEDEARNLVPEEKGGLAVNSRWATDASLREILRQALLT